MAQSLPRLLPKTPAIAATSIGSLLGITVLVVLSAGQEATGWPPFWRALGVLTIVAAAAFAAGGLIGFVFGIPRIPNGNGGPEGKIADNGSSGSNGNGSILHNSNLVQVSDWLTKILLGAGLTQMGQIGDTLARIAVAVTEDTGVAKAFIAPLIIYFVVLGFLSVYVWTVTIFTGIISRSLREEVSLVQAEVSGLRTELSSVQQEVTYQRQAWSLIEIQLNRESREPDTPVAEIRDALARLEASDLVKIFYHVRRIRQETWQRNKPRMARTMPIFEALIELDREERFHRSHAQLGYCHKDRLKPDYAAALACLTRAIEIRNRRGIKGWTNYEFNRALCRIALEREQGGLSPAFQDATLVDLRVAADYDQIGHLLDMPGASPIEVLSAQPEIWLWCHANAERVRHSALSAILDRPEPPNSTGRSSLSKVD